MYCGKRRQLQMTIRQEIEKLKLAKSSLLDLVSSGIMDSNNTAIQQIIMEEKLLKKQFVKERHNGEIKEKSRQKNGKPFSYWWAEVPLNAGGYKQITATTEERLYEKLYSFYDNSITNIVTLEDAYEEWHKQREVDAKIYKTISGRTWDDDADSWNRFWAETKLASMKVKSITIRDILNECKSITGNGRITLKSFNRAMNILNQIWDLLIDEGIVNSNLPKQVPKKRLNFKPQNNNEGLYYTREQRNILLQFLYDLPIQSTYSLAVSLSACLGKRIGEIRALTWEDYNPEKRTLKIHHQIALDYENMDSKRKTDMDKEHLKCYQKPQIIPLSMYAVEILSQLKKINGNKKYILNSNGTMPIGTSHFNKHLKKYCEACGIPYYSSHKFRFYGASEMYEQNIPETEISAYLNHSDIETTRGYDRRAKKNISESTAEVIFGFTPNRSQVVTTEKWA